MKLDYLQNIPGVYLIINKVNSKVYVGSAKNVRKRILLHLSDLRKNQHHSKHLQRVYNKHRDIFIVKLLETVKIPGQLRKRELYWINFYRSYKPENGYNICRIPDITKYFRHTIESKEKMSRNRKGKTVGINNHFYGKTHSKETLDKITASKVGKNLKQDNPNYDSTLDNIEIKNLLKKGKSIYRIAKLFKRQYSTIKKRVKDFNLDDGN